MKRLGIAILSLAVLGLPMVASAKKSKRQAEAERVYSEVKKAAKKNQWSKVEREYKKLIKLRRVTFAADAHFIGAQSSRSLGDVQAIMNRLTAAQKAGHNAGEVNAWLTDLKKNYGKVIIKKQAKKNRSLAAAANPFAPDQRAAIAFAAKQIKAKGKFKGWLPAIEYTMGSRSFTVSAGRTTKVKKK
jgi:hypothetical protein